MMPESFYQRNQVVKIACELIGKILLTRVDGITTGGMIVETEAYSFRERGCHAYQNNMTPRNEVMFEAGGVAYVYLCYGIHHLFNIVTNQQGTAEAVLIRALEPVIGMEHMQVRMKVLSTNRITSGPGKLTKALGIDRTFNGKYLAGDDVWVDDYETIASKQLIACPRIGIDYAGEDAKLPWRFYLKDNTWVSKK